MKRKASPTLIGSFVVVGLLLVAAAVIALAGGSLFARKEKAVMFFGGSVYGLQVGAPVVFRGVRVGSVTSIGVLYDRETDSYSIPVRVDLDGDVVSRLDGNGAESRSGLALPALVKRGMSAQLQMQSLLTGMLYVDLDLRPNRPAHLRGKSQVLEIPTTATAIQALKNQLDGMDFRRMAEDVAAIAASARSVVSGPEVKQSLQDLAQIAANVKRLSARLDEQVQPLAGDVQRSLAATREAMDSIAQAAAGVDRTAQRLENAADRATELLAPDSALVQNLQRSADEVARTAGALRQAASGDSTLVRGSERALEDLSRAARALRDLAETQEQQPEALLRGREVRR